MTAADLRRRAAQSGQRTDRPASSDVATTEPPAQGRSLIQMISDLKPELANALPKHVSVDRVARIAITALRQTPNLGQCVPESFLGALMTASQLGLEVNTPAGEAYLIPYKRECTLVVGYQGIVKLFWQSPLAKHIDAQAVYARDQFEYEYGLAPRLVHKPAEGADRGEVVNYYAVATLSNGGSAFVVLSPDEVKRLRQGKVGPKGDIADPMRWMERKTALKQMLKLLPKTVELQAALAADEQVRTEYAGSLEEATFRTPVEEQRVIDVQREPDATAAGGEAAGGQVDGCPGCGEAGVVHSPTECPATRDSAPVHEPTADELAERAQAQGGE